MSMQNFGMTKGLHR